MLLPPRVDPTRATLGRFRTSDCPPAHPVPSPKSLEAGAPTLPEDRAGPLTGRFPARTGRSIGSTLRARSASPWPVCGDAPRQLEFMLCQVLVSDPDPCRKHFTGPDRGGMIEALDPADLSDGPHRVWWPRRPAGSIPCCRDPRPLSSVRREVPPAGPSSTVARDCGQLFPDRRAQCAWSFLRQLPILIVHTPDAAVFSVRWRCAIHS